MFRWTPSAASDPPLGAASHVSITGDHLGIIEARPLDYGNPIVVGLPAYLVAYAVHSWC